MRVPFLSSLSRRPPELPAGIRIYAVGDVHGRADLLAPMLGWIRQDSLARDGSPEVVTIFLGDLIDRGPASAEVLDLLVEEDAAFGRRYLIRGNHEEVLLRILDGDMTLIDDWFGFGGEETLLSYGVDPALSRRDPDAFAAALHDAIPPEHVALLRSMHEWVQAGDYLFVHAGIRPGVPLDAQRPADLRWIRREFLSSRADHGMVVVHGHTVSPAAQFRRNRIGIDTGAYATGHLTVLGLEGQARWTLTSRMSPR